MRRLIDNIITTIIVIVIIAILLGTVYFCLDVFKIIEVPQKYSIAALFYSKIEVIAAAGSSNEDTKPVPDNLTIGDKKHKPDNKVTQEVTADPTESSNRNLQEIIEKMQEEEKIPETEEPVEIVTDNATKYYYEQLDDYGKHIYDKLYENKDKLKNGDYTADFDKDFDDLLHQDDGEEVIKNSFQLAINALTFDNPELFYIDVTKMYLLTETTTRAFSKTYRVSIGGNGNSYLSDTFGQRRYVLDAISVTEQYKREVIEKCDGLNTVDKIKLVHDYLVDSIEYDANAGHEIYNIYGALAQKKAVCEGYARAFKYILDELDIPCIIACGIAQNSTGNTESHAWNYVQIDGQWYAVDVTWDDPVIIGNGKVTKEIKYAYFLRGGNKFYADHYEDGNIVGESNFKYPKLSVLDY